MTTRRSRSRRWINRDDGHWLQVQNRNLRWFQVCGGFIMVGGGGWLLLTSKLSLFQKPWIGWARVIVGAAMLSWSSDES